MKLKTIKISILDLYLLRQLTIFFVFSVSLFAAVGVTIGTVSELTYKVGEHNLPLAIAIVVFFLKLPVRTFKVLFLKLIKMIPG